MEKVIFDPQNKGQVLSLMQNETFQHGMVDMFVHLFKVADELETNLLVDYNDPEGNFYLGAVKGHVIPGF